MSTFGGLDTLFNPSKRHLDEEKLRLQSTREEVGDASGGKRIDLDSGRVKISRGPRASAVATDEAVAGDSSIEPLAGDSSIEPLAGDSSIEPLAGDDPADDPDATVVATTEGHVRMDATADDDPATVED